MWPLLSRCLVLGWARQKSHRNNPKMTAFPLRPKQQIKKTSRRSSCLSPPLLLLLDGCRLRRRWKNQVLTKTRSIIYIPASFVGSSPNHSEMSERSDQLGRNYVEAVTISYAVVLKWKGPGRPKKLDKEDTIKRVPIKKRAPIKRVRVRVSDNLISTLQLLFC